MLRKIVCLLAVLATAPAIAALPATGLTVRFLPLDATAHGGGNGDAFIDIGRVVGNAHAGNGRGITIRRRIAVQLDGSAGNARSARLSVVLTTDAPGCSVRVDGLPVSAVPRLVAPAQRIGVPVPHDIELTIPADVPAGPFLSLSR